MVPLTCTSILIGFRDSGEDRVESSNDSIPLPDIKQARQKKEAEEMARKEEQMLKEKRRIKRSDKEAFTRVSRVYLYLGCFVATVM